MAAARRTPWLKVLIGGAFAIVAVLFVIKLTQIAADWRAAGSPAPAAKARKAPALKTFDEPPPEEDESPVEEASPVAGEPTLEAPAEGGETAPEPAPEAQAEVPEPAPAPQ